LMLSVLWKLTKGHRLTPWKSPYLRWRLETYTGIHAETITFEQFFSLSWRNRKEFLRYLSWAERMSE
jgi:hypothetical protein